MKTFKEHFKNIGFGPKNALFTLFALYGVTSTLG